MKVMGIIIFLGGVLLLVFFGCDLLQEIKVASAPILTPSPGHYDNAVMVSLETETPCATIRYTTDSSVPSKTHGTIYGEPFSLTGNTIVRAIVHKDGYASSDVVEGLYTITTPPVSNPTFSYPGGTYQGRRLVEIQSATESAIIRYTLDGSDPTPASGNIYTSAVNIHYPCTLKAIAFKDGLQDSGIMSASFDISYTVGSIGPGGGYVFFDKGVFNRDTGTYDPGTGIWTKTGDAAYTWRFLEAAPSSSEGSGNNWGGSGEAVDSNRNSLGGGWWNTFNILSEFGSTDPYQHRSDYAARYADSLLITHDADIASGWYLPSFSELKLLYGVLYEQGLGDFVDDVYWSSTAMEAHTSYTLNFFNGVQTMKHRYEYHRVRAIRAF